MERVVQQNSRTLLSLLPGGSQYRFTGSGKIIPKKKGDVGFATTPQQQQDVATGGERIPSQKTDTTLPGAQDASHGGAKPKIRDSNASVTGIRQVLPPPPPPPNEVPPWPATKEIAKDDSEGVRL